MTLTFGSLFAGIGGIDLGLERAGMECRWQVEIDPYATRVLEKHWPNVRRYSDVRTVGAADLDPVDVLAGGFPCQDISHAGRGAGIGGERSGLWTEYARLIRDLRPRYVFVENVAALLGRGLGAVLGDLAEGGYDAEWQCIPASAVGAPHRRDRIWIVAYPQSVGERAGLRPSESGRVRRGRSSDGSYAPYVADTNDHPKVYRDGPEGRHPQWHVEPAVDRVAHGVSSAVDRIRCVGNAVVPQVAEYVGRCIVSAEVAS